MGAYRKHRKIRKHKRRTAGKDNKRIRRNQGSTPSVDKILGPIQS